MFNNKPKYALAFLPILATVSACTEIKATEEVKLRPITYLTAQDQLAGDRSRVFSGTVSSAQESELSFKVSGTIANILVSVGDKVSPGDTIATLDTEKFEVSFQQARASLAKSNATKVNAEAEYQRVRQLYAADSVSRNELDSALAELESARAAYNAEIQAVRLAELDLAYTELTAVNQCSIGRLFYEVNENVSQGQTIVGVVCGESWDVTISVAESLIGLFQPGLEGDISFPSFPQQTFKGIVKEVSVGNGTDATFPVTVSLVSTPGAIRSGLAAEAMFSFTADDASKHYLIPPSMVGQDAQGQYVYQVIDTNNPSQLQLQRVSVEIGEVTSNGVEIVSGIEPEMKLLAAGLQSARDGMLVRAR